MNHDAIHLTNPYVVLRQGSQGQEFYIRIVEIVCVLTATVRTPYPGA